MRIYSVLSKKLALTFAAFYALMVASSHNAQATTLRIPGSMNLSVGDTQELGFVQHSRGSATSNGLIYVNHLIGMALGTTNSAGDQTYTRSTNNFGNLPTAVSAGRVNRTGTTISLGTGGLYEYLFANYGGPRHGTEVWYIGNLHGSITVPLEAGGYRLSRWTLFGPAAGVPDGGATVMLLGGALGVLGVVRRYRMSS
jgi:hypothetical protein